MKMMTWKPKTGASLILLALVGSLSISSAWADPKEGRGWKKHGHEHQQQRHYQHQRQWRNDDDRYWQERRYDYQQPYYYAQPVYVPPPVIYEPRRSAGINLFFPLDFRR